MICITDIFSSITISAYLCSSLSMIRRVSRLAVSIIEIDTLDEAIKMTLIRYLLITSNILPINKYPGNTFNAVKRTKVAESCERMALTLLPVSWEDI